MDTDDIKNAVDALLSDNGITLGWTFVPWEQSRNRKNDPSLNYVVTIKRHGRELLTTDYMLGQGYCPAYNLKDVSPREKRDAILHECNTGKIARVTDFGVMSEASISYPHAAELFYCLISDSDVLDYSSFESWAKDFGFSQDLRISKRIYRQCLGIAHALKNGLGDKLLGELKKVLQDY